MARTKKKKRKSKRKEELIIKKKGEGNLFKKYWKPEMTERKVKKPSVDVDGLCSSREIFS